MGVTERSRERIRRIGLRRFAEPEQRLDHPLHLRLLGSARADDRLLDVTRRVLVDRQARAKRRAERGRARLTELEGAVGVAMDEDALDRDLLGRMRRDDAVDLLEDPPQTLAVLAGGPDASPSDGPRLSADRIDDAETGDLRARIDTEDADGALHGTRSRHKRRSVPGRTMP